MEYGDSKNALFVEPNAYIQNYGKEKKGIKKIVFSEPYESLPSYHINNDFKKHNCKCIPDHKPDCSKQNCQSNNTTNNFFDFKNFLPMLTGFLGKGFDMSSVSKILNNNQNQSGDMMSNIMNILSSDMGKNILGLLGKKSTKNTKKNSEKYHKIKSSDIEIDNFKRVN